MAKSQGKAVTPVHSSGLNGNNILFKLKTEANNDQSPLFMSDVETKEFLRSVINNIPHGIIVIDAVGKVRSCNELALVHLQLKGPVQNLLSKALIDQVQGIFRLVSRLELCLRKGPRPFDLKKVFYHQRYFTISGRPIPEGMVITTSDITGEVSTELAGVSAMLEGQEMERQRLSKEIHDGIGPLLSTLRLSIEGMKVHALRDDEQFNRNYENAVDLLQTVTREVRTVSHALMPSALLDFGLVAALENLCQKARESGQVQVAFYQTGLRKRLGHNLELNLYRIAQELLNNAFRHANAQNVSLQLIQHPTSIILMVEDDGRGFDREKIHEMAGSGSGLQNVRIRTRYLGGTFTMDSYPGKGVLATVEIPLDQSERLGEE